MNLQVDMINLATGQPSQQFSDKSIKQLKGNGNTVNVIQFTIFLSQDNK